jgi:hypothetical protein
MTERDAAIRNTSLTRQPAGANKFFDISRALALGPKGQGIGASWDASLVKGVPQGVINQINVSLGITGSAGQWNSYGGLNPVFGNDVEKAKVQFQRFLGVPLGTSAFQFSDLPPPVDVMQAPFTPTRQVFQTTSWAANDPLVHYRVEDLLDDPPLVAFTNQADVSAPPSLLNKIPLIGPGSGTYSTLSNVNTRYNPWGGRSGSSSSTADHESGEKDPHLFNPDFWDFPTYKFANIGWLGRVHRGTPWQTIISNHERFQCAHGGGTPVAPSRRKRIPSTTGGWPICSLSPSIRIKPADSSPSIRRITPLGPPCSAAFR